MCIISTAWRGEPKAVLEWLMRLRSVLRNESSSSLV